VGPGRRGEMHTGFGEAQLRFGTLRCVILVVCSKTNGEVKFSPETQLW